MRVDCATVSPLRHARPRRGLLASAGALLALLGPVPATAGAQGPVEPGPDVRERANGELVYQDASRRLVALRTDDETVRPVHGDGSWIDGLPDVSPDGAQVLFVDENGRIARVPMRGGDPEVLAPSYERYETSPVWRPDGAAFAFVRKSSGGSSSVDQEVVVFSGPGFWDETTVALPPGGGTRRISFTPDGRSVAFDAHDPASTDPASRYVGVLDLHTGEHRVLVRFTPDGAYDLPDVAPDGSRVAFRKREADGGSWLCTVPLAGGDEACVAGPDLAGIPVDDGTFGAPAYAPDSTLIAFSRRYTGTEGGTFTDLATVPAAGGGDHVVHRRSSGVDRPFDEALDWAPAPPAGQGRIYVARSVFPTSEILSVRSDGSDLRTHVTGGHDSFPSLSADGALLAVVSRRDRPEGDVYVMTPGGRAVRRVTDDALAETDAVLSPDGRTVAFTRGAGPGADVYLADVATGVVRRLSAESRRREDPMFHPDGEHLAYATQDGTTWNVHLVALDGTGDRILTEGTSPAFTPDGSGVAVTRFTGSFSQIWFADVAGGSARQLTFAETDAYRPSVSPDGAAIAYATGSGVRRVRPDGTGDAFVTSAGVLPWWAPEPPAPVVTVADVTVTEEEGPVTLTARLARAADTDVSVRLRTVAGGDAAAGADHDALDRTLTIPAGTVSATAQLQVHEDLLDEPDETVAVEVTATGATVARPAVTVTIADDDAPPAMAVDDLAVDEGEIGSRTVDVTVRLDAPSGRTVRAHLASEDRTATAGSDYDAVDRDVTFAPGETSLTVPVTVHGDTVAEGEETLALVLSAIEHATAPVAPAVLVLREDDVEGEAPETAITTPPGAFTPTATPSVAFIGSVPGGAFECRVDDGAWTPCTSPWRTRALTDGPHRVAVRALAGPLPDPTPAEAAFVVDTERPETTFVRAPARITSQRRPVFELRASETVARFDCRVDGGPWTGCDTPWTAPTLADGRHVVEARAVDRANLADETPAAHAFVVDATPPQTRWTDTAAATAGTGAVALAAGADGAVSLALTPGATDAGLPVTCPADATSPCSGELTLERDATAPTGVAARAAARPRARRAAARLVVLGRTRYTVRPGARAVVPVPVPDAVRWEAERRGAVALRLRVRGEGDGTLVLGLRLRPPAGPRLLQAGLVVPVRSGVAALRVACPPAAGRRATPCAVRVGLRRAGRVLAGGRVTVRPGRTGVARLRLGRRGLRLLGPTRSRTRLVVDATVRRAPARTRSVRLTLTRGTR